MHRLHSAQTSRQHRESQRVVEELFLGSWEGGDNTWWQQLEGLGDRKTALSDHLLAVFTLWGNSFVGISSDFEQVFELNETLASIAYLERTELAELERTLGTQGQRNWVRMPVGRSGWHSTVRDQVLSLIQLADTKKELLEAGFANGSEEFFDRAIENFSRIAGRMEW